MGYPLWKPHEDATLRRLAGKKPASVIGLILGRPKNGIHHRIKKLKLDGRMCGENHWNAKIDDMQAQMIGALYDAGFTINEIHKVFTSDINIGLDQVCNICSCRSRTG